MNARNKILRKTGACLLAGMLSLSTPVLAAKLAATASKDTAEFSFTDLRGEQVRLTDFRGKWVLVNFWAPWCPLCRAEVPHLNHIDNSDDIAVVGIAMDYGPDSSRVTQMARSMAFVNVLGGNRVEVENASTQVGLVHYYPTSYLYNPKGERVAQLQGQVDEARVRQAMQESVRGRR